MKSISFINSILKLPRKPCKSYLFGEQVIVVLKVHTIACGIGLFDKVLIGVHLGILYLQLG